MQRTARARGYNIMYKYFTLDIHTTLTRQSGGERIRRANFHRHIINIIRVFCRKKNI